MARPREFDEDQALDTCMEEFRSRSYAGTSTQGLCDSTGLSRSSLYNTFHSKGDLYRQALQRYDHQRSLDRASYLEREGTGRELLEALLLQVVAEQQESPDQRSCLVINAAVEIGRADDDVAEVALKNLAAFQDLMAQLIRQGQDDGSISSTLTPEALAAVAHATLNGIQVRGRVARDDLTARQTVQSLLALM